MKIKDVLERAEQVVLVDRQKEYNQVSKTEMHARIAEAWSATLGRMVTPHEVALCMVQLKVIRAACQPGHEDSYVDMVGYATIAAEIMHEEKEAETVPAPKKPLYNAYGDLRVTSVSTCNWCSELILEGYVKGPDDGFRYHPTCAREMKDGRYAKPEAKS